MMMQLTHKITLCPTGEQAEYFQRAAGTARFVWNWALAEWNRQYASGQKPNAMALKKQFNAIKYHEFPWIKAIHRDAHAQPFAYLAKAWNRFFADIKAGKPGNEPLEGKVLGATVSRTADRWFIAVQVEVSDDKASRRRISHGVEGVDLEILTQPLI